MTPEEQEEYDAEVNKRSDFEQALVEIRSWTNSVPSDAVYAGYVIGRVTEIVRRALGGNDA